MPKSYQITPLAWLIKDEVSVKFHVKSDDYFGTMAAILSLIKQQTKKDKGSKALIFRKILKNLETDLLYLQKYYQIKLRRKKKNKIPKGKLISQ